MLLRATAWKFVTCEQQRICILLILYLPHYSTPLLCSVFRNESLSSLFITKWKISEPSSLTTFAVLCLSVATTGSIQQISTSETICNNN